MKKKYCMKAAMAVAVVGSVGLAGSAWAAISLDDGTGVNVYANEIAGAVSFSDAITAKTKMVMPAGSTPYVKFSCTSKLTTASPDLASTDTSGGTMATTNTLVSGGNGVKSATYSSALAPAATPADDMAANDVYTWGGVTPVKMNISTGESATCTYEIFESQGKWEQDNAAATTTNTVANWSNGLLTRAADTTCAGVTGCNKGNYATIDLTTGGKKFVGNKKVGLVASLNLNARFGDSIKDATGGNVSWGGMIDTSNTSTNVVISGDFTAAAKVWHEAGSGCSSYSAANAATLNADKTQATFKNTQLATGWGTNSKSGSGTWNGEGICMEVDGSTVMNGSHYTAVVNLKPGTGFNIPASVSLGEVGNVADNGSTAQVNLMLSPGGAYPGYLRVSHLGPDSGDITLQLINDSGSSVLVPLGDISGQSTSTLGPKASTTQMPVSDIYAAAQTVDPTFAVTGENKLRIVVKSTSTTGVDAQVYSVSKDGNSFIMMR